MEAGELLVGVDQLMIALDVDQVERVGVGDVLVMIGRLDFQRDEKLLGVDRIRMRVKVAALAVLLTRPA